MVRITWIEEYSLDRLVCLMIRIKLVWTIRLDKMMIDRQDNHNITMHNLFKVFDNSMSFNRSSTFFKRDNQLNSTKSSRSHSTPKLNPNFSIPKSNSILVNHNVYSKVNLLLETITSMMIARIASIHLSNRTFPRILDHNLRNLDHLWIKWKELKKIKTIIN